MEFLLWLRVQIVRFLLRYNDRRERKQEPKPLLPNVIEQVPSPARRGFVQIHLCFHNDLAMSSSRDDALRPAVIDFHGGGFSTGVPSMNARWASALLATATRPVLVGVEYALAPENPFPAAIQDAVAVVTWLSNEGAQKYRLDPARFILSGFSAGGTLALTAPLWMADERQKASTCGQRSNTTPALRHPLRGILSVYPKVDYRQPREIERSLLSRFLSSTWDEAYARRSPVESPFVSPAAADDHLLQTGLPARLALYPVADDALLESCEEFRRRLVSLDKHVTGDVEPDAAHAWDKMSINSSDARRWAKRDDWFSRMARDVEEMLQT